VIDKLSADDKQKLKILLEAELYRRDFYEFLCAALKVLESQRNWKIEKAHKRLCDETQEIVEAALRDEPAKYQIVLINIPPRTLKSITFSICLNAWVWCRAPHEQFTTLSNTEKLATNFTRRTRQLMDSHWYQLHFGEMFKINKDENRLTVFSNDKGGTRESFGFNGSITGQYGCKFMCIDDPQMPSESLTKLENVQELFSERIFNRVNDVMTSVRFIIQQRTDEKDLTGYVLKNYDKVKHICLPMELTENTSKGYEDLYTNGLLLPSLFPREGLIEYKKHAWTYNTQYLQNPKPREGDMILTSWFLIHDIPIEELNKIAWEMFVDTAQTEGGDESAAIIAGKYGNNLLIKKCYSWQLNTPDLVRELKTVYQSNNVRIIRVEPKSSGHSVKDFLVRDGFNCTLTPSPKDSKVVRVSWITPILESKRVICLTDSRYDLLLQECAIFPNSDSDGLVDVLYYAVNHFLQKSSGMKYKVA